MRRPTAILLLLTLALSGCYKWVEMDPLRPELEERERLVRITHSDSTAFLLQRATVEGDSLVGWRTRGQPGRVKVFYPLPLANTERVEVQRFDAAPTVAILLPVAGLVGFTVVCVIPECVSVGY